MIEYSAQVNAMCPITKGPKHGPAPIPEEGQWVKAYKIEDISGYTHGVGWCAPQQGTCKLRGFCRFITTRHIPVCRGPMRASAPTLRTPLSQLRHAVSLPAMPPGGTKCEKTKG